MLRVWNLLYLSHFSVSLSEEPNSVIFGTQYIFEEHCCRRGETLNCQENGPRVRLTLPANGQRTFHVQRFFDFLAAIRCRTPFLWDFGPYLFSIWLFSPLIALEKQGFSSINPNLHSNNIRRAKKESSLTQSWSK